MITTKDVAREAGVSYTTVSHVINNTRSVSDETKRRVEDAIKKLGYCPNVLARSLRMGETKTVGVVTISSSDPYFAVILHAMQEYAWNEGYGVFVSSSDLCCPCSPDEEEHKRDNSLGDREQSAVKNMIGRDIQGLILNSLQTEPELIKTLDQITKPCIVFQRHIEGTKFDTFVCDDYQGTSDAVEYLISLGHTKIAFVKGFAYATHSSRFREAAWREVLTKHGIAVNEDFCIDAQFDDEMSYNETKKILSIKNRPTAILYSSDIMAVAGMRAAKDIGLSIPEELSVIGYDNLDMDQYTIPRLTSINQDSAVLGHDMMKRLLEKIKAPSLKPLVKTYPQKLVIRESTGKVQTD
jgi:LacI family transcriptional regulator